MSTMIPNSVVFLALGAVSAACAGTVTLLPTIDGVVYDLNPADGTPDLVATDQHEVEAGTAYSYYRDGRIGRAFFEFELSQLEPSMVQSARLSLRVVSYRIGSYFDLYAYSADGLPSGSDWSQPGAYLGRYEPEAILSPFRLEVDVTDLVRQHAAGGVAYIGFRAESGPKEIGGVTGFASVQWPKETGPGLTPEDDPQIRVELVPEAATFTTLSGGILLLLWVGRRRDCPLRF